jgi:tetratricopeptide (TPR) repeat protein
MSQIAIYCGWYDRNASGPFTLPKVEFMPGAFAYHLHSFSAYTLRSTNEFWVRAAARQRRNLHHGLRVRAVSLPHAERRRLSRSTGSPANSPLARPPGPRNPRCPGKRPSLATRFIGRLAKSRSFARGIGAPPQPAHRMVLSAPRESGSRSRRARCHKLAAFLENLPATTNSAVLTEKLADFYQMQGKPSSAIETYQRALTLNPSPEQRIRIRLTLGEKLLAQNRETDAIENYQQLLKESPDYPGKPNIEAKLAALEPKPAGTNAPAKP